MEMSKNNIEKLYLNEAMKKYQKKFKKGYLNLLNAPAGSGKTTFIFNELLKNTKEYADVVLPLNLVRDTVIYVCDTTMLKDSVLKDNSDITKVLGDKAISKMVKSTHLMDIINGNSGKILVITYQSLGWLLKQPSTKSVILKHCNCIILDEIHNLYKYAKRFNTELNEDKTKRFTEDGTYIEVLDNLDTITKEVLTIGVSATINSVVNFYKMQKEVSIDKRIIFNNTELQTIREYNFEPFYTNCIMNKIKLLNSANKFNEHKTLIYTNTIRKSIKLKEWFKSQGIIAEWLCSINNKKSIEIIDEETGEVTKELIPTMSESQLALRKKLLHDGILPKDLQVLIVNGSYETGWNLRDEEVQIAIINSCDRETQIQARNRIRHDIQCLITTCKYDKEGFVLELKIYPTHCKYERVETRYSDGSYYEKKLINPTIKKIDDKFIRIKLTPDMKREMLDLYAMKPFDKEISFKGYLKDIEDIGYVIKNKGKGTYIFSNKEESDKFTVRGGKRVDKLDKYLKSILSIRLDAKGQQKLIKKINLMKKDGTLQDKASKLSEHLQSAEYDYVILSKFSHGVRYWIVEETQD